MIFEVEYNVLISYDMSKRESVFADLCHLAYEKKINIVLDGFILQMYVVLKKRSSNNRGKNGGGVSLPASRAGLHAKFLMKQLFISLLFCGICLGLGSYDVSAASLAEFPEVQGPIFKKISYTDSTGKNDLVLTQTESYPSTPNPSQPDFICGNQEINAYAYSKSIDSTKPSLMWRMHDFVHDCETSATCEFAKDSPVVTDLDGNGVSEVWLVYYIGCRGDVSPIGMKILMYEGGKKHALRGETFVHVDGMDMGGSYQADQAFAAASPVFRKYADQLWQKYKKQ